MKCQSNWNILIKGFCVMVLVLFENIKANELLALEKDLTLTSEQKNILDEFKALVSSQLPVDYMKEDMYLVRWLRAKNWNIKRAENFLMQDLKWREENNMYKIQDEDWSDFEEHYKYWLDGRDKEGKPIVYFHVASWDLRRAILIGQQERFLRYIDHIFESTVSLVRDLGHKYKNVSQAILIVNLDGYNLVQHGCVRCIPIILRAVLSYENHYPGYADKIFLLNTPATFQPLLNTIKAVLSIQTNEAFNMFGTNRREWKEALLKVIDENELPIEAGGTKIYKGMDDF